MFGKCCQSLLSWFSGAGCVDNHNFKTLNYDDTSGPFKAFNSKFQHRVVPSSIRLLYPVIFDCFSSRNCENDMFLGCAHLEPLLQHPSVDRSQAHRVYIYIYISLSLFLYTMSISMSMSISIFWKGHLTPDILPGRLVTAPPQTRRQRWIWFAEFACVY